MREVITIPLDTVPAEAIKDSLRSALPQCCQTGPFPSVFGCTRSDRHDGPHVASGTTEPIEAWETTS